jgi:hypothetical protein
VRLLADLRDIFTVRAQNGMPLFNGDGQPQFYAALFTDSILSGLYSIAEAPWSNYYGRQLNARDLAGLFGQFGVESREVRIGAEHRKGYRCDDLWDAWTRYA